MSHEIIRELAEGNGACALVTVIRTEGSVPRHAGAKMLVRSDGSTLGTVGGGNPEALAISRALLNVCAARVASTSVSCDACRKVRTPSRSGWT